MTICIDSRKATEGDIFFCIKGVKTDGHKFADSAVTNGAKTVVYQHDLPSPKRDGILYVKVKDTVAALGEACNSYFGHPSQKLTMFGITGTNGKSSIAAIISQIYSQRELCGNIGTINIKLCDIIKTPELTTPNAVDLHRILKCMLDKDAKAVAVEVSSHALSMGRVNTIDFDYAIFTNLTHDHLDYYGTLENYFEAKKELFKNLKPEATAIFNKDSDTYETLSECCSCRQITYAIHQEADYMAKNLCCYAKSTNFTLVHRGKEYPLTTNLAAEYNVSNLLAAIAAMHQAGMSLPEIIANAAHINQIPGRMEHIDEKQDFHVIVDYAHTPDGFEKIFQYAKTITPSSKKIFSVFGSAGGRDIIKRGILGSIADKYCDTIFLTTEDPRNEKPSEIAKQIQKGITKTDCRFIEDRATAIHTAVQKAEAGDCILILAKGDEPYLYLNDGKIPWPGDQIVASHALKIINEGGLL